jgi:23S rRNA (guanosine2251-2'-O)-methyltransferase
LAELERVFGKHSVRAVFLKRPKDVRRLLLAGREDYHQDFLVQAQKLGVKPEFLGWPEFLKLGGFDEDDKHQGICAFVAPRPVLTEKDFDLLADAACVLMLDQISNPQNLATILRCAAFFHADAVMLLRNRSVDITPTVTRYAVGGAEFVDLYRVTNLSQSLEKLKALGFWAYGLDERGEKSLAQMAFHAKTVFVIGAEGEGLRQKTQKYCDELVRIPGGRDGVESLNAAVAASMALYEFHRLKL